MTTPNVLQSRFKAIARRAPFLRRLHTAIGDLQREVDQLKLVSEDRLALSTRLKIELADSRARETELSETLASAANQLSEARLREDNLSKQLAATQAALETNAAQQETLLTQLSSLQTAVSAADAHIAKATDHSSRLKIELADSRARETQLSETLADATRELSELRRREEDLSAQLAAAQATLSTDAAQRETLLIQLSSLQTELSAATASDAEARRELVSANARIGEAAVREETLSRELASSTERAEIAKSAQSAATALSEELYDLAHAVGPSLRDQMTAQANVILGSLNDLKASLLAQFPSLSSNIFALQSGQEEAFRNLRNRLSACREGPHPLTNDLYLDLLEASLTGMIHADPSEAPWADGIYDPNRRALGLDWPSQAETMIGRARMRNLRMLTQRVLEEGIPGDLIETGVWRGGACIYMMGILAASGDQRRRVFVADSFRGLPTPNAEDYPADEGDQHHQMMQLAVSRDQVEENFRRYGLLDERVIFLEGWFKDTLPSAPIDALGLLRLDGDMYESTMDALNALYGKVSPGGFVIIDDYVLKPCAQAVDDFRSRHKISAPLQEVDGAAKWWQVPY
ncbi:putative nucleic acid-binding Zn-ribbon protein [Bradyrhizobium sp. CIR48]|uniref:TylF/MycF family methyltransferase n=1 Tax=Bradyrhizobium sp. CIR48 TaxID=2663840 RepID=UPI0017E19BA8|nr:TylF/MycF family methyltransferase [Bradyrhizobium sp. CIR48]MBB4428377.1 putative nucleic acid-binding Zn-ribbon protein [Bradyrhizobium sp. CIR48]